MRLPPRFVLTEKEQGFFARGEAAVFPFQASRFFFSKIDRHNPEDPIRRQIVPSVDEFSVGEFDKTDPLAEARFTFAPRLVHRYADRCIIKVTGLCAVHCRFCFRKNMLGSEDVIDEAELAAAARYITAHREIKEVLLTGGDPLTIPSGQLEKILQTIRDAGPDIVLRIGTRLPVVLPGRITGRLAQMLCRSEPLWMTIHCNHPAELSTEMADAVSLLAGRGIPLASQSVLLKGVNDDADVLAELFQKLLLLRVQPYYLFALDLASGTGHFRVPLEQGLALMRQLRERLPAQALPVFALDLPDGGGKLPVEMLVIEKTDEDCLILKDLLGNEYRYPRE
jgi:lysine 2,3-aminomutase